MLFWPSVSLSGDSPGTDTPDNHGSLSVRLAFLRLPVPSLFKLTGRVINPFLTLQG